MIDFEISEMKTMRALVKKSPQKGLWMEEVPMPTFGIDDVLIKVDRAAICGTDIHIYNWDEWARKTIHTPMVIGHEFVGDIVAVGANVNAFKPGQTVSGEGHFVCGHCRNCMAGRRHLCTHTIGVGVNRSGVFAEYVALPWSNVWEHVPGIDLDIAAIFDPFGNAVHAALQFELHCEDVLISGAGPIGIMAAAVCKSAGARHIVVTDINPSRLALAKKLGATRVVDVRKECLKEVQKELGMKEGFDVGLEMSGSGEALSNMVGSMCHGGKISLLGIPSGNISVDWTKVIFNMLTIKGVYGREIYETWYKMSLLIASGLDISPVITHRFPFEDFQQGFEIMAAGKAGKVILFW